MTRNAIFVSESPKQGKGKGSKAKVPSGQPSIMSMFSKAKPAYVWPEISFSVFFH